MSTAKTNPILSEWQVEVSQSNASASITIRRKVIKTLASLPDFLDVYIDHSGMLSSVIVSVRAVSLEAAQAILLQEAYFSYAFIS